MNMSLTADLLHEPIRWQYSIRIFSDLFIQFLFKTLHICSDNMQGFAAIFDSQTENFLSQKGQSTKSTKTEYF